MGTPWFLRGAVIVAAFLVTFLSCSKKVTRPRCEYRNAKAKEEVNAQPPNSPITYAFPRRSVGTRNTSAWEQEENLRLQPSPKPQQPQTKIKQRNNKPNNNHKRRRQINITHPKQTIPKRINHI